MIKPVRLQLSRRKGFNLQAVSRATNGLPAVNVARPACWGNPFKVGSPSGVFPKGMGLLGRTEVLIDTLSIELALEFYRRLFSGVTSPEMYPHGHKWRFEFGVRFNKMSPRDAARSYLRGHNLGCWCGLDRPCHADILLEFANAPS